MQIHNYTADEGKRLERIWACTGVPYFRLTLLATLMPDEFFADKMFVCVLTCVFCVVFLPAATCRSCWNVIQSTLIVACVGLRVVVFVGPEVKIILSQSGLSQSLLAQIW